MISSDENLAQRAAYGDDEAFSEMVRRYQSAVFSVARRLRSDAHKEKDDSPEAFLRAYRFLDGFDPNRPFRPWLLRIPINICLNLLEKHHCHFPGG